MNPGVGERRAGLGATRTRGFHHGLLHPGGGSVGLGRGAQRVVRQGGAPPCRRGTGPMTTRTKKHEGNDEHEGDEEEQGEHDEQERSGIRSRGRSNEDLMRRFVDDCRRTRRRTPDRSPHRREASSQNSPHRTHGWFFPRRRRLRIARCRPAPITRLSGQPRPGAPSRVRPTRGGSGEIRPQPRAGGQAVPGARIPSTSASPHDRARTASTRRTGTRNAARFRMNAATLS